MLQTADLKQTVLSRCPKTRELGLNTYWIHERYISDETTKYSKALMWLNIKRISH